MRDVISTGSCSTSKPWGREQWSEFKKEQIEEQRLNVVLEVSRLRGSISRGRVAWNELLWNDAVINSFFYEDLTDIICMSLEEWIHGGSVVILHRPISTIHDPQIAIRVWITTCPSTSHSWKSSAVFPTSHPIRIKLLQVWLRFHPFIASSKHA